MTADQRKINYSIRVGGTVRYVVAVTGASGIAYGVRMLESLPGERILVISDMAKRIIPEETGLSVKDVEGLADTVFDDHDLFASISSGSYHFDAMIVAPCSSSTLAKIAAGLADTLITRAAAVAMKESRKLILITRETPKSVVMLENELKLARCGVTILDANPGFYSKPKSVDDIISFIAGRCLDQLRIEHSLYKRWE